MIRMNIKNNTATFTQNRTQVESVDLRLITSHQDIAQWADHLSKRDWYTGDIRARFETECIRRINRY